MYIHSFLCNIFIQFLILCTLIQNTFAGKDDPIVTHYNNFIILKDYIEGMEIVYDKKKAEAEEKLEKKELDEKDFFEMSSLPYPVIIQNESDFLVIIISTQVLDFSSPRFIAPHEALIEYIDDMRNFRMYRINPASSIVNVAGLFTATSTFTTIAATTFFIYSAPLSIPMLVNAFMFSSASVKAYKWIKSIKERFPIANNEIDPGLISVDSIAKITITNSDDETSINAALKIENAKNLIFKYKAAFTEKMQQLKTSNFSLKFSAELKPFEQEYKNIMSPTNNDPEFNHKAAKLFTLYHQMMNTFLPPQQTSTINKLINWVTDAENQGAIMNVIKAIN